MNKRLLTYCIFITSLFISSICMLIFPKLLPWLRINWVLLVFLYWVSFYSKYVGVFCALIIGVFFDLFTGSLLGSMSFSMIVMASFLHVLRPPLKFFKLTQQILIIFLVLSCGLLLHFWIQLFIGKPMTAVLYVYTSIFTALAWPIVSIGCARLLRVQY